MSDDIVGDLVGKNRRLSPMSRLDLHLIKQQNVTPSAANFGTQPDVCRCGASTWHLFAIQTRNGKLKVRSYCITCASYGNDIPRSEVDMQTVPLLRSNACAECKGLGCHRCQPSPCERCGDYLNLHQHHIAPYEIFRSEWNQYPTVTLCQPCHSEWHRRVDTYYRAKYRQDIAA
jgi:hypothetical protein